MVTANGIEPLRPVLQTGALPTELYRQKFLVEIEGFEPSRPKDDCF